MAERAGVSSIEAIEEFRNRLVLYLEKAGLALDEVSDEVLRTRVWLESDRRSHWENQIRLRRRELEQRQQELFSAQLCGLREAPQEQRLAVQRARLSLSQAEDKLQAVKRWRRQYEGRVEPLAKDVDKLRQVLDLDMGKGVIWLDQVISTLRAYAQAGKPAGGLASDVAQQVATGAESADQTRDPVVEEGPTP